MSPGDRVDIYDVWAGGRYPSRAWFSGYEFVRDEGQTVLVKQTKGLFAGVEYRYAKDTVRPSV